MIAATNESRRGKQHSPEDYDPFIQADRKRQREKQRRERPQEGFSALRSVFVGGAGRPRPPGKD